MKKPATPAVLKALHSAKKLTPEQRRRALDREIVKRHLPAGYLEAQYPKNPAS